MRSGGIFRQGDDAEGYAAILRRWRRAGAFRECGSSYLAKVASAFLAEPLHYDIGGGVDLRHLLGRAARVGMKTAGESAPCCLHLLRCHIPPYTQASAGFAYLRRHEALAQA